MRDVSPHPSVAALTPVGANRPLEIRYRMDKEDHEDRPVVGTVLRILLLAGFVALTFPSTLLPVGSGLDASWVLGLN
jgi:hypothetical protein